MPAPPAHSLALLARLYHSNMWGRSLAGMPIPWSVTLTRTQPSSSPCALSLRFVAALAVNLNPHGTARSTVLDSVFNQVREDTLQAVRVPLGNQFRGS